MFLESYLDLQATWKNMLTNLKKTLISPLNNLSLKKTWMNTNELW